MFDPDRTIQIVVDSGPAGGSGTGFVVAPRMILTALHVLVDIQKVAVIPPASCRVRSLGDRKNAANQLDDYNNDEACLREFSGLPDTGWCHAELVWPAPGTKHDRDRAYDLALLKVTDPSASNRLTHPKPTTFLILSDEGHTEVGFVGFPDDLEQRTEDGRCFRRAEGVTGIVQAELRGGTSVGDLFLNDQYCKRAPENWRGVSGAALLTAKKEVVGLVRATGRADHVLQFTKLPSTLKHPEFWRLIGNQPLRETNASEHTKHYLHFIDRHAQWEAMLELGQLMTTQPSNGCRVAVVTAFGQAADRLDLLIKRYCHPELMPILGYRDEEQGSYSEFNDLGWPGGSSADQCAERLQRRFYRLILGSDAEWLSPDPEKLGEALRGGVGPRLFRLQLQWHTRPGWAMDALCKFFAFLSSVLPGAEPHLFVLSVMLPTVSEDIKRDIDDAQKFCETLLSRIKVPPSPLLDKDLGYVGEMSMEHFDEWLGFLRKRRVEIDVREETRIRHALGRRNGFSHNELIEAIFPPKK